jgi:metal-responsive CopG/Arc/MetJ family transcriptional regulator
MIVSMKRAMHVEKAGDTGVARVTISLPADLFARGEEARVLCRMSRSAFVAQLYQRYLDELEEEGRVARYRAAYAALLATPEEESLTEASMDLLARGDAL